MYILEQIAHKHGEVLGVVLKYWHLKKTSQSYQVQIFSLLTYCLPTYTIGCFRSQSLYKSPNLLDYRTEVSLRLFKEIWQPMMDH